MKTIACLCRTVFFCFLLQTACSTNIFAQSDTIKTDDYTYGKGGTKTIIITRDKTKWTHDLDTVTYIKDRFGKVREQLEVLTDSNNVKTNRHYYYNRFGLNYIKVISHDQFGTEIAYGEKRWDDSGKVISGFIKEIDENGKKHVKRYNTKTEDFEEVKEGVSFNETPFVPNTTSSSPPFIPNQVFFGLSAIREDSKPKGFFTYGGEIDFNHFISQNIALDVDLGLNAGSSLGIDYTKKTFLIGVEANIMNKKIDMREEQWRRFYYGLHLRGGISSITSSVGSYKSTSNIFTADLGIGLGKPLNKERTSWLGVNLDYIPTISSTIKNNVRASAGLGFGIKSKHSRSVKTSDKKIKWQRIY